MTYIHKSGGSIKRKGMPGQRVSEILIHPFTGQILGNRSQNPEKPRNSGCIRGSHF